MLVKCAQGKIVGSTELGCLQYEAALKSSVLQFWTHGNSSVPNPVLLDQTARVMLIPSLAFWVARTLGHPLVKM